LNNAVLLQSTTDYNSSEALFPCGFRINYNEATPLNAPRTDHVTKLTYRLFSGRKRMLIFVTLPFPATPVEAAHEKTHKDTDNFLVTVGAEPG
jgi:hypothetical protein